MHDVIKCSHASLPPRRWRCPQCHKTVAIRDGSFFSKSKITLQKWLILLYWWVWEYPVTDASEEAQVTRVTAVQAFLYTQKQEIN